MAAQAVRRVSEASPTVATAPRASRQASRAVFRSPVTVLAVAGIVSVVAVFVWHQGRLQRELVGARQLVRESQPTVAMEQLTKLAARWPECAEIEFLSAVACRRAERFDLVEPHLSRAAELGWDPKEIDRQRYLMFFQAGDFLRSGGEVKRMVLEPATDDEAEEFYEATARGYVAGLLFREAKFMLSGWLEWRPESVAAHLLNADLAVLMDDQETEIAAYREILKFAPRNFEARRRLGRVLTLTHDNEEAQELLMSCLREKPHDTRTLINLADWCHRNGQSAVASKYLATVLATRSDARERASALVLLGQIDIEQGEHDQAASHLREAVESDPTNVGAVYSLSQALSRAGRSDEANSYFERWERLQTAEKKLDAFRDAIIAHPDDPSLRSSIGEALLEKGEAKAGVNWLLSALFHDPKHAQTHRLLADHYERLGETELAARHRAIAEGTAEPTEFVKPNAVSSSSQPVSPARHPQ